MMLFLVSPVLFSYQVQLLCKAAVVVLLLSCFPAGKSGLRWKRPTVTGPDHNFQFAYVFF